MYDLEEEEEGWKINDLIFVNVAQIQFSDRVLIYQRDLKNEDFKYHLKDKISQMFECSLLVMCMDNLILCHERKLQCLSFTGVRLREWILESHIRYIRSVGGKKGKEVLIAGLKNGQVSSFSFSPFCSIHFSCIQFAYPSLVSGRIKASIIFLHWILSAEGRKAGCYTLLRARIFSAICFPTLFFSSFNFLLCFCSFDI